MVPRGSLLVLCGLWASPHPCDAGPADTESRDTEPPAAIIKPPPLPKGGWIGLVAPASPLQDALARAAVENLERRGYRVKLAPGWSSRRGYLAGRDADRAESFNALIRDPSVDAVICLRGGYGSPRILDRIDYEALKKDPKIIIGYSDITALLLAIHRRAGLVTFHGPMGKEWSAPRGLSPYSEKYYWPAFSPESSFFTNWGGERAPGMKAPATLAPGVGEGVITGGNLSVLCSTLGTPYEIDCRDAILFIEEVSEKPFRIDRMLNQLRLAGKLAQARGILLGGFTGCDLRDPEGDLTLAEVFADYFGALGVPVLADYPAGHVPDQAALPIGVRARLDAGARTLSFLEAPVSPPPAGGEGAAAGADGRG